MPTKPISSLLKSRGSYHAASRKAVVEGGGRVKERGIRAPPPTTPRPNRQTSRLGRGTGFRV